MFPGGTGEGDGRGPSVDTWDTAWQLRAQTWGRAHQRRRDERHRARTPPTAGCLSVCPPVHQNSWVPVGWARAPCGRTGHAKLQACSRSLKGKGSGQLGGRALGQGLRPLCPSLGHGDPCGREAGRAGRVTTSGAQARSMPLAAPAHRSRTTNTQACSPRRPVSRCGGAAEDEGRAAEAWLSSLSRLRQAWASSPGAEKLGGVAAGGRGSHGARRRRGGQSVLTPRSRMWSHPRRTPS